MTGEPIEAIPQWARRADMKPPTMSLERPFDVFEKVAEQGMLFEAFASCGTAFSPAACFCCSICMEFLVEPAACHGCEQVICSKCWRKHREVNGGTFDDFVCPLCRSSQPEIRVARYLDEILQHELRRNGIRFKCNSYVPGSHPGALWCCQKQFNTLTELRSHLEPMAPFRTTRIHVRRLLTLAVAGSKEARETLFDDPVTCNKLSVVLKEDAIVSRVAQSRLVVQRSTFRRSRSRSPRAL